MIIKSALASGLVALLATSAATAQNIDERQTVMPLTIDGLSDFLADAGWSADTQTVGGESVIVAEIEGKTIVLWPRACDGRGICAGLMSFAALPDTASSSNVNEFNVRYPAARATLREGRVVLDSYTYADFGVVRGSLLIELAVLAGLVDDWWAMSDEVRRTRVSFNPIMSVPDTALATDFPFSEDKLSVFSIGNAQ